MDHRQHLLARTPLLAIVAATALLLAACQRPAFLEGDLPDDGPQIEPTQEAALRFVEKVVDAGQAGALNGQSAITVTQAEVTSFLSIASQVAQMAQQLERIESVEDLEQLQGIEGLDLAALGMEDLDLEGIDLERLQGERDDGQALRPTALKLWQALSRRDEGLGGLSLSDLRLSLAVREPQVYFKDNGHVVVRGYVQARNVRQPVRVVVAPHARRGELALDFVEVKLGPLPLPESLFDAIGKGLSSVILAGQDYAEIQEIVVGEGTLTVRGRYAKERLGR